MKRLSVLALCAYLLHVCGCKQAAETITEKSISAAKETTKGISEGIDKGRKSGESLDGAEIVSSNAELEKRGSFSVFSVRGSDASDATEISLAFENTSDKPIRISNLEVAAFDRDGFVKKPTSGHSEITIPARGKDVVTFSVRERADRIAKVRVWNKDVDVPATARK